MEIQQLKPNTEYRYSPSDWEFILELTKVASVHALSHQVTITSEKEYFQFNDILGDCPGLSLPNNWFLEFVSVRDGKVHMTFNVEKTKD